MSYLFNMEWWWQVLGIFGGVPWLIVICTLAGVFDALEKLAVNWYRKRKG